MTNEHEPQNIPELQSRDSEPSSSRLGHVVQAEKNEYEENERQFERALLTMQGEASAVHSKEVLEIVRNRMDADLCYMVQGIRKTGGGSISPGHAIGRNAWTNARDWTIDPGLGRAFDERLMSGSVVAFRGDDLLWLKGNINRESPQPGFAAGLSTVHACGVRSNGSLVGVLCVGYCDGRSLSMPLCDFLRRAALVVVTTMDRISTYHDLEVALNASKLKGEIVEYMFKHQDYGKVKAFLGEKVCKITGAQHLMLYADDGSRDDWFGEDAPSCCRDCAKASASFGKRLPQEFFAGEETVVMPEGTPFPDMNLPSYCPMTSSAIAQFKTRDGWWRMVADYTKPHRHSLANVAQGLHTALEFLSISYDRERREKTITKMQEHQQFRADALALALSKDDLPGLIDFTLKGLVKLTACDYIAIHTIDGDHNLMHSEGKLEKCPQRCEGCSFYNFLIPPTEDEDHIVELKDAKGQTLVEIPSCCPAKSLEVVVVYSDGKPWGGIALHYLEKQDSISDDDRDSLKIAANVLTLAVERHAAAVHLKKERDKVMEAEKARSYFFSAVSHDIRTPLNAIIGFSELLQDDAVPPDEAKRNLKLIASSGKMLLQLVNDVLDLSKMDLDKLEFKLEPSDVGALMREPVPMFQPMMDKRNQTFDLNIAEMPILMVDPHRFRQVLFNFVSNAVKYAGPCTISIVCRYENGRFKLTVADNGQGVPPEKAKRLMQPFVQADIKNRTEGCGLGLSICKRLIELANGTISIDTAPGEGFAIHVEVPVEVAKDDIAKEKGLDARDAMPSQRPKRVLIVDDSPVNRMVLKAMVKKVGITDIDLAEDGKTALDKLEKDPTFDLVLTDMWMPVMDGAELIGRIRADQRLAKLRVCSITADVEARLNYKQLGFDALLLKPVTIEKMSELLGM